MFCPNCLSPAQAQTHIKPGSPSPLTCSSLPPEHYPPVLFKACEHPWQGLPLYSTSNTHPPLLPLFAQIYTAIWYHTTLSFTKAPMYPFLWVSTLQHRSGSLPLTHEHKVPTQTLHTHPFNPTALHTIPTPTTPHECSAEMHPETLPMARLSHNWLFGYDHT